MRMFCMHKAEKVEKSASLWKSLHKYLYIAGRAFCRHTVFFSYYHNDLKNRRNLLAPQFSGES